MATYTYNARNQIASTQVECGLFTSNRVYDGAGRNPKFEKRDGSNKYLYRLILL